MTIEEMKTRKRELGYSYQDIARLANMPLSTVQKIFGGTTQSPRRESLLKIQAILAPDFSSTFIPEKTDDCCVSEPPSPYSSAAEKSSAEKPLAEKKPGEYTLDDYYALPEDRRVELIDGYFYEMLAPSSPHQIIGGEIYAQLLQHRKAHKGPCLPLIAPTDVQLDCDDRTMVEPDVMIVCNRSKIIHRCVYGAPDFVAEVLSPSTRKKDMSVKMQKYINAGVREYWLIDPDLRKVIVYDLEHLAIPVIYGFSDPIPVGIWNGECRIDLSDVSELLDDLFPDEKQPDDL